MEKLKVRPMFSIGTVHFIVDIDKQVLREFQRPENEISFIHDMTDKGTHYTFSYDLERKNVYDKTNGFYESEDWTQVKVPTLCELDPEGMATKYGYKVEQVKGKPDFEVMVDQEALALRYKGMLPRIDISGEAFVVDLRMQELRHAANFHPVISLKSLALTNDGWHYEAYYHLVMKQVVEIDPKLLEFPEGLIKIKIPTEIGLDPVSAARIYGMDERELLRHCPIQKELKAEIIPLSETHIPALIQRNREALRQEHRENMQRAKPRLRPKF